MFITEVLISFAIAALLTSILGTILGYRRAARQEVWSAILLLLATWAGGVWLTPFGPPLWNIYWLPFLASGFLLALLLLTVMPRPTVAAGGRVAVAWFTPARAPDLYLRSLARPKEAAHLSKKGKHRLRVHHLFIGSDGEA